MEQVDVAIVGGGPAGTAAARAAATRGASALVLEKGVPRADRDRLGPDSTDAAGFLDYWTEIAGLDPDTLPEEVIHQTLSGAEFVGPTESVTLSNTGINSEYPHFGFAFDRAKFDDWHREQAEAAGADYRVGTGVRDVETTHTGTPTHNLVLADGSEIRADYLVLADGPQRRITMGVLDQYLPPEKAASKLLSPPEANHIAYQEYRRFPADAFDADRIKFWWGWLPGHTAYPWVFPNSDRVARVGLTMPIGMSLDDVPNPQAYELLKPEDESMPSPREFLDRFLETVYGAEYDIESEMPRLENYGKDAGTETYPISSTRPIDSPTDLGIAVVGGAMGATSAFHEGGDHLALRTGTLAGELAASENLSAYNRAWKDAAGPEMRRNVALSDMVRGYGPADWDRVLGIGNRMLKNQAGAVPNIRSALSVGVPALKLFLAYRYTKFGLRDDRVVQIAERDYEH
ncbi:electron transfer flavoprotein [Halodesulfurarchaeum formicicum]|uniref:Electron transfer flavoprotein n=1 Tax=Halodesulfurarchaeum formicicum TaxID=1873524 RepID=A0A1D8S4Q0_9EURY|nr:NAD(P)/FAD-dependent oxidoreductase [Halodesulfurarchaeum formicicum]AOW80332.1 electron transfer flavoprotein [Halodesulfurarchaeum formicicum]APE95635.1 electron transfer flavoprotein [Halodesulfurarchaeum formicicum]